MFNYITDILYRNHNFKISLLFFGDSTNNNDKFKNNKLINVSTYNNTFKIFLNTFNKCNLILENIPPMGLENKSATDKIVISQRLFYDFDMALTICLDWLKLKHFKYLFNVDSY